MLTYAKVIYLSATKDGEQQIYSDTLNFEDCATLDSHEKEAPTEAVDNVGEEEEVFTEEQLGEIEMMKQMGLPVSFWETNMVQGKKNKVCQSLFPQGLHRLEQYLNIQDCLEKSLKIKIALKSTCT